ncbi:MAG: type IV pili methyl-accepting chemotaxis transducer N-terminal domain-containing protein, partial [Rhodothermales bacterium]
MVTVKGFFAKSITAKMAVCVVVMLVLSMASIGAVFVMVGAQKTDVRVINEAGRLRMLSQKMTKAALLVASGEETAREELLATAALFEKGLTGLSHGDAELGVPPAPDDVEPQLTLLAQHWTEFHANVRLLAEAASGSAVFNEAAAVVRSENLALLTEANNTVTLFEQEAVGKISHLNRVLMVILALDGIAFVLVLLVVSRSVRPLVELAEVADRVVSGNLAVSVPVDSRDEVGALGRSFNAMVGHLREAHDELERSNAELA